MPQLSKNNDDYRSIRDGRFNGRFLSTPELDGLLQPSMILPIAAAMLLGQQFGFAQDGMERVVGI